MNPRSLWRQAVADPAKALLVLLAFCLPFDHTPSVQVYGLSLRISAIIGVSIILLAFYRLLKTKELPRFGWQWWVLLAWLLWVCAGSLWATDTKAAAKIVVPLLILGGVGLASPILWKKQYLSAAIKGLLGGTIFSVVFGFYQFIGNYAGLSNRLTAIRPEYSWQRFGFPRMESTAIEPLYFSAYLLLPIGLLSVLLLSSKQYRKWYWYVALGFFLLADFLTLSRGGLAALVAMYGVLFIQYWRAGFLRKHLRLIGLTAAAFLIIFAGALGVISLVSRQGRDSDLTYNNQGATTFVDHLKDLHFTANAQNKAKDDSIAQRETARQEATHVLGHDRRVLLIGTGPGQYAHYESTHQIVAYSTPNNILLEQLVQSGVIGFVLLIAWGGGIIWSLLRRTWSARTSLNTETLLAKVIIAYLLALFFQAQSFTGLSLTHLWYVVGLALFLLQLQLGKTKHKQNGTASQEKTKN